MVDSLSQQSLHVHLVSDSTGDTVLNVSRACLSQFQGIKAVEHLWPLIRTETQIERVISSVLKKRGIILYTMVDDELSFIFDNACRVNNIPAISVLSTTMHALTSLLGGDIAGVAGRQHRIDSEYFDRIRAIEFTSSHDDGAGLETINDADIVLSGISRTSKSPTCFYLAHRGLRAANIPFVPEIPFPDEVLVGFRDRNFLLVGLTRNAEDLVDIRRNRLRQSVPGGFSSYADLEVIRGEVLVFRDFCREHGIYLIDVSKRSVEETVASIMRKYGEYINIDDGTV